MYVVILAGGGGTRLRPVSRPDRPKPFLPLLGPETLFQRTVRRLRPLVAPGDLWCVTDRRYGQLVREQAPDVQLLLEPVGRNTAAAIAFAAAAVPRPDQDVMLVVPADHWIEREDDFRKVLRVATEQLAAGALGLEDPLVTLGVRPTRPATDYGYLRADTLAGGTVDGLAAWPLTAFEEKPAEPRARELLNLPGVAWNAGVFAWRRRAILAALERYTPLMTELGPAVGSEIALARAYERLQPLSIDKAVMEPAAADRRVLMGAMDVGWSDLGSWTALLGALVQDSRGVSGRVLEPGDRVEAGREDLLVRVRDGRLVAEPAGEGTIVAEAVLAHLAGGRRLAPEVEALLDRVERQESRA